MKLKKEILVWSYGAPLNCFAFPCNCDNEGPLDSRATEVRGIHWSQLILHVAAHFVGTCYVGVGRKKRYEQR